MPHFTEVETIVVGVHVTGASDAAVTAGGGDNGPGPGVGVTSGAVTVGGNGPGVGVTGGAVTVGGNGPGVGVTGGAVTMGDNGLGVAVTVLAAALSLAAFSLSGASSSHFLIRRLLLDVCIYV